MATYSQQIEAKGFFARSSRTYVTEGGNNLQSLSARVIVEGNCAREQTIHIGFARISY